jgi:hypothetical protein
MFKEYGAAALSDYLRRTANALAVSFHRNDWRAALLRALAENALFCAAPESYLGLVEPA